jgi:CRP/FNR family transcriptional regulator
MAVSDGLARRSALNLCPNAESNIECVHCGVRRLSVCGVLDDDELLALDRLSRAICFPAKRTLLQQDEPADFVHNITSGAVRLYKLLPDGRRQIIGFALPGDFLGLSLSESNAFSADALTMVTACQFTRYAFSDFLDSNPHFLRRLHSMASHELSLAQDQMVLLGRRSAEEKVAAFLIGLRKRWARIDGSSLNVPLPMTRQDIGDFLGLTVETVSRMLSRFARQKALVIVPDGVRLIDVERMERLAES